MRFSLFNRKAHRWGAVIAGLPLLVIIGSGLLLQFKKDVAWVQPATQPGVGGAPTLTFEEILAAARTRPDAGIQTWDDVDRLDVRPDKSVVKVRGKNRWEVQVDTANGQVLQVAYRRSDLIENIHDGSFFHDAAKLWIFLPAGVALLGLWLSGSYMWFLPIRSKLRKRRKARAS